jgi:hypothetical protein
LTPHNYVNPFIFQMLATIWLGVKVRRRFTYSDSHAEKHIENTLAVLKKWREEHNP